MSEEHPGPDPWLGRTLASQFRILERLGEGGMGAVYLAEQIEMGRRVVVKVMHGELSDNATAVERFKREARAVARLNHPHIVQIYVFGDTPEGDLFLAMEFVDGRTLTDEIQMDARVPQPRALRIGDQICSALTEAHAAGIVHRDLKPDNIMLAARMGNPDYVKVLDFGIAKLLGDGPKHATLTQHGYITGTPQYMSPEQARAQTLDARSDIYSLGVILYEMLTGAHPYKADSAMDYLVKHITEPVIRPTERFDDLRLLPRVETLIERCLAKKPEDRYQSAAELQRDLRQALRDFPDASRPWPTPGAEAELPRAPGFAPPAAAGAPAKAPPSGAGGLRVAAAMAGVALLLAGAAGAAWWFMRAPADAPSAPRVAEVDPSAATALPQELPPELGQMLGLTDEDPPDEDPPPVLAAGEAVDGVPVPRGLIVQSRSPQSVVLQGPVEPSEVLDFYEHHLGRLYGEVNATAQSVSAVSKDALVSSVSVSRSTDGVLVSVALNPRVAPAPKPLAGGTGSFGEPILPGAVEAVRTATSVIYHARQDVVDVVDFYEQKFRRNTSVLTWRGDTQSGPMLTVSHQDDASRWQSITVMRDPQDATGGRVMIVVTGR